MTFGYNTKEMATIMSGYKLFYDLCSTADIGLKLGMKDKMEYHRIGALAEIMVSRCFDVLREDGLGEEMYKRIKELNEMGAEIKAPNLESLVDSLRNKK